MLFLFFSFLAFAANCPELAGKYICDGKLPGYENIEISHLVLENGKQEFSVLLHFENGQSRMDLYQPDEPGLHGKLPNGGNFMRVDRCEGNTLIQDDIGSGRLPNGKLRAVLESQRFVAEAGQLRVSHVHEEYLDDKIVRAHTQSGICRIGVTSPGRR